MLRRAISSACRPAQVPRVHIIVASSSASASPAAGECRPVSYRHTHHAYHTRNTLPYSPYLLYSYQVQVAAWQRRCRIFGLMQRRRALAAPSSALTPPAIHTTRAAPKPCPARRTAGPQDRRAGLTRRSQEYRWAASNHCVGTATCTCDAWMPLSPPPALLLHPLALCHPLHVTRTVPPLPARPARPIAVPSTRPRLFTPTSSPHTLPPLTGGVWGRVGGTRGGARWRYWSQVLFALVCCATRVAEWPMCSVDFFVPCRLLCDSSTCQ